MLGMVNRSYQGYPCGKRLSGGGNHMNSAPASSVIVGVDAGPDVDEEELSQLSRWLRDDILELDVERVDYATNVAPTGAKSGAAANLAELIISLSNSAVLTALVGVLRTWVSRDSKRKVSIQFGGDKLEITGAPGDQDARLISRWLATHAGK
jgi:Effector Associated Constant Component 1